MGERQHRAPLHLPVARPSSPAQDLPTRYTEGANKCLVSHLGSGHHPQVVVGLPYTVLRNDDSFVWARQNRKCSSEAAVRPDTPLLSSHFIRRGTGVSGLQGADSGPPRHRGMGPIMWLSSLGLLWSESITAAKQSWQVQVSVCVSLYLSMCLCV